MSSRKSSWILLLLLLYPFLITALPTDSIAEANPNPPPWKCCSPTELLTLDETDEFTCHPITSYPPSEIDINPNYTEKFTQFDFLAVKAATGTSCSNWTFFESALGVNVSEGGDERSPPPPSCSDQVVVVTTVAEAETNGSRHSQLYGEFTFVCNGWVEEESLSSVLLKLLSLFIWVLVFASYPVVLLLLPTLLVVLLLTWKFQKIMGKLVSALLISFLVDIGVELWVEFGGSLELDTSCPILELVVSFASIAPLVWLAVINYNFWQDLAGDQVTNPILRKMENRWKFVRYCGIAWGTSVLSVGIMAGLEVVIPPPPAPEGMGKQPVCRARKDDAPQWLVMLGVMLVTMVFISLTLVSIRKQQRDASRVRNNTAMSNFRLFWKLSMLMGLSWIAQYFLVTFTGLQSFVEKDLDKEMEEDTVNVTQQSLKLAALIVIILPGLVCTVFLFHFFLWGKREEVKEQIRQVFRDPLGRKRKGPYEGEREETVETRVE